MLMSDGLYLCDPEKHTQCKKTCCSATGGDCYLTKFEKFSVDASEVAPVKRGRWIWKVHYLVCSECGEENDRKNYCPNCGARMGGGENG